MASATGIVRMPLTEWGGYRNNAVLDVLSLKLTLTSNQKCPMYKSWIFKGGVAGRIIIWESLRR